MFEYIRGKLAGATPHKAIIDVNGIGYGVLIALNTYSRLPQVGQELLLYVAPIVREDAHLLYGFLLQEERNLFEKFTLVSGIGPKTALALIGHMEISDLQMAILHGNIALLSKVPGIGKKTAERLVIEMRDKMVATSSSPHTTSDLNGMKGVVADAISALVNLGYHPVSAQKAVKHALGDSSDAVEPHLGRLITQALRVI